MFQCSIILFLSKEDFKLIVMYVINLYTRVFEIFDSILSYIQLEDKYRSHTLVSPGKIAICLHEICQMLSKLQTC